VDARVTVPDIAARDDGEWTLILQPTPRRFELGLRQLWSYRDLVGLLVRRDFVATYQQTILGPVWFLIQPLVTTLMFVVIFGQIAELSTDGQPKVLFYMLGTVLWSYFAACLVQTASTFVTNAALFGKVYFPRLVVPVATVISNLITLAIQFGQFIVIAGILVARGYTPKVTVWMLATPLLVVLMAALGLGAGLMVSSLTTRYRDMQHVVTFGTPLLMYATPVIYPLSSVPAKYRLLVLANPMTPIVEAFRYALLGSGTVSVWHLAYAVAVTVGVLLFGIALFNRTERTFMDTV
jgi:lipopolysaccharide transport system permease protein